MPDKERKFNTERLLELTRKQRANGRALDNAIARACRVATSLRLFRRRASYFEREIFEVNARIRRGEVYVPEKTRKTVPKGGRKLEL